MISIPFLFPILLIISTYKSITSMRTIITKWVYVKMLKYLLPETGNYYKANLYCHTNISDGTYTPEQVKQIYKEHGYSIVAFTEHDVFIPHPELCDDDFLALNGFEVEINEEEKPWSQTKSCHLCFIQDNEFLV